MDRQMLIRDVYARVILDLTGNPAVEVEVLAGEDTVGTAAVLPGYCGFPGHCGSGEEEPLCAASRNRQEEIRWRAEQAVENVNSSLAQIVTGMNVFDQEEIDRALIKAVQPDGKETGEVLGISLAAARTAAGAAKIPLFRYLGGVRASRMPVPVMCVERVSPEEEKESCRSEKGTAGNIAVYPARMESFREMLEVCTDVCRAVREMRGEEKREEDGRNSRKEVERKLDLIRTAAGRAGYRFGEDINAVLDITPDDPVLIRWNRAATLTELFQDIGAAREAGRSVMIVQPTEGTADTAAADIAVAFGAEWFRCGPPLRPEYTEVYNRLLRIDEKIACRDVFLL